MTHSNFYTHLLLSSLSHEKLYENKEFILSLVKDKNIDVNDIFVGQNNIPDELITKKIHDLLLECGLTLNNEMYASMRDKIINNWSSLSQEKLQPLKDSLSMFEYCLKEPHLLIENKTKASIIHNNTAPLYKLLSANNLDLLEISLKKLNISSLVQTTKEDIQFNIFKHFSSYHHDGKTLPKLVRILDDHNLIKLDTIESKNLVLKKLFPEMHINMFNMLRGLFNSKVGKKYFNNNELLDFITDSILDKKEASSNDILLELKKTYNKIDKKEINYQNFLPKIETIFNHPKLKIYNQQLTTFLIEVENDSLNMSINQNDEISKKKLKI